MTRAHTANAPLYILIILMILAFSPSLSYAGSADASFLPEPPEVVASVYTRLGMEQLDGYDGVDRGKLVAAEVWFRRALEALPGCSGALVGISRVDMYSGYQDGVGFGSGSLKHAMEHVDAALAASPGDPGAHVQKGYILFYEGRIDDASAEARLAQSAGGAVSALFGEIALRKGEYKTAGTFWEKALVEARGKPGASADAYDALGEVALKAGDYGRAAECFREALTLRPGSGWEASNLALALIHTGKLDEAVDILNIVRGRQDFPEADRNLALAYLKMGVARQDAGEEDEAEGYYLKAIDLDPGLKPAYMNLAAIYERQGSRARLAELCRKAITNDPADPWAVRTLAEVNASYPGGAAR